MIKKKKMQERDHIPPGHTQEIIEIKKILAVLVFVTPEHLFEHKNQLCAHGGYGKGRFRSAFIFLNYCSDLVCTRFIHCKTLERTWWTWPGEDQVSIGDVVI